MHSEGSAARSYNPSTSGLRSPRPSETPERWDDIGPMRIHLSSLQLLHQQTEESIKDMQTKLDNVAERVAKNINPQLEPDSMEMLSDLKLQQAAISKQIESRHAEVQLWQADMLKKMQSQHSELLAVIQDQLTTQQGREALHKHMTRPVEKSRYRQMKVQLFHHTKRWNAGLKTIALFLCLPLVAILIFRFTQKPEPGEAGPLDDSLSWLHAGAEVEWNPRAGKEPKHLLQEHDWIGVTIVDKEVNDGAVTYSIQRGNLRTRAKQEEFRQLRTDT
eukprot:gnl/MRDRNA2_/MRDRNA2_27676_c0_seq1.p1 gnl/MRDRNA2_/MRDRNA2_27676_c0~~gnl/MRDRNA2_/MRDRNA2_27676_c0_seq1.p1  ORF type:complete len:275 (+),score=49.18 gnl/MRDRNA2_/MRDRNA2_27676_c0_seq1:81-905(+)